MCKSIYIQYTAAIFLLILSLDQADLAFIFQQNPSLITKARDYHENTFCCNKSKSEITCYRSVPIYIMMVNFR